MKERPILFNNPMVQAILQGRKTQTRRLVKNRLTIEQAEFENGNRPNVTLSEPNLQYHADNYCPFGQVGDLLWVRETFRLFDSDECPHSDFPCGCPSWGTPLYRASHDCFDGEKWTPSIHMPRWASRILLEITNIRVERLQDISEEDAVSEGMTADDDYCAEEQFSMLWTKTYGWGEKGWNENPWVWVVDFKVIQGGES